MWDFWIQVGGVLFLLLLGYSAGTWRERSHFSSLRRREAGHEGMKVTNLKAVTNPDSVRQATLVMGDAVIATDYFKSFLARLRNIVGGEVRSFKTLMDRARREAKLRMLDQARELGAGEVWNVRFETSNIRSSTNKKNPAVSVEIFAFGTAVIRK